MKSFSRYFLALLLVLSFLVSALSACARTDGNIRTDLTAEELSDRVLAALPATTSYQKAGDDYISSSTWGEAYSSFLDLLADYRILLSDNIVTNSDEIGVFRLQSADDAKTAAAVAEEYVQAQQLRLKELLPLYNPGDLPKTDNGRVTVCGTYILYTILSDADTARAHDTFRAVLTEVPTT